MPRTITVAAAQLGPIARNDSRKQVVGRLLELMREAHGFRCDLIAYPELALTTFFPRWPIEDERELDSFYETEMPGPETKPLFEEAARRSIGFSLGFAELVIEKGRKRRFNSSILVDKTGRIVGKYRKVHLPGHSDVMDRPGQHLEKRFFEVGDLGFPVWRAFGGILGMCICNDRRWPETYRVMGLQGVEMVLLGYNSPIGLGDPFELDALEPFHNHLVMQSGAYQNATWVVGVAKAGFEEGFNMIGQTCIIAPSGEIVAQCATMGDELVVRKCDLDMGAPYRADIFNFAYHRRIEHYKLITERTGAIPPPGNDVNAKPAMGQDWKIEGYLGSEQGRLTLDGVDLVALAHERGTPLFVYSARRIAETARTMKTVFAASHPRSTICYAAKALSTIKVLRLLHAEGIALEVNSGGELFRARLAGIPPDAIVFNGVAKSRAEIAEALSPPIKAINVDSLFELERIGEVAADLGCQARVTLRIVPEVDSPTSPGNRTGSEGTKFGILLHELDRAMEILRAQPNALRLVGIHAHVGSQITDTGPYVSAANVLVEQARRLQDALGLRLEHVNLGGGFPLPYMRGVNRTPQGDIFAPRIDSADIARAGLAPLRKGLGEQIEILVEPGRRMVGDSAVTLATVETVKTRAGHDWLYLDAGYNTIVESYTYKWYYHSLTANKLDEPLSEFRVVGPLCDNGDAFFDVDGEQTLARLLKADPKLAQSRDLLESTLVRLPPTRKLARSTGPGDVIAFLDTGAYTLDQITPNNGRPRPEVGMLDLDGRYEVMRRRDSYTDLLFNEVI